MVIRFPLQRLCVFLGIICCIYGSLTLNVGKLAETGTSEPLMHRTIIIDAGHGGCDGGAVGFDGIVESQINLKIAAKLNTIGNLFGTPTIMTRKSETISYPEEAKTISQKKIADQNARLRLIRDYPHGILFSIHQNTYPSQSISGIQVLYGHTEESEAIGTMMQNQLNDAFNPSSRRMAAEISNDIYLLRNCDCTAVLIECGFISNPKECQLLQKENYQTKLAVTMLATYFQYINIMI